MPQRITGKGPSYRPAQVNDEIVERITTKPGDPIAYAALEKIGLAIANDGDPVDFIDNSLYEDDYPDTGFPFTSDNFAGMGYYEPTGQVRVLWWLTIPDWYLVVFNYDYDSDAGKMVLHDYMPLYTFMRQPKIAMSKDGEYVWAVLNPDSVWGPGMFLHFHLMTNEQSRWIQTYSVVNELAPSWEYLFGPHLPGDYTDYDWEVSHIASGVGDRATFLLLIPDIDIYRLCMVYDYQTAHAGATYGPNDYKLMYYLSDIWWPKHVDHMDVGTIKYLDEGTDVEWALYAREHQRDVIVITGDYLDEAQVVSSGTDATVQTEKRKGIFAFLAEDADTWNPSDLFYTAQMHPTLSDDIKIHISEHYNDEAFSNATVFHTASISSASPGDSTQGVGILYGYNGFGASCWYYRVTFDGLAWTLPAPFNDRDSCYLFCDSSGHIPISSNGALLTSENDTGYFVIARFPEETCASVRAQYVPPGQYGKYDDMISCSDSVVIYHAVPEMLGDGLPTRRLDVTDSIESISVSASGRSSASVTLDVTDDLVDFVGDCDSVEAMRVRIGLGYVYGDDESYTKTRAISPTEQFSGFQVFVGDVQSVRFERRGNGYVATIQARDALGRVGMVSDLEHEYFEPSGGVDIYKDTYNLGTDAAGMEHSAVIEGSMISIPYSPDPSYRDLTASDDYSGQFLAATTHIVKEVNFSASMTATTEGDDDREQLLIGARMVTAGYGWIVVVKQLRGEIFLGYRDGQTYYSEAFEKDQYVFHEIIRNTDVPALSGQPGVPITITWYSRYALHLIDVETVSTSSVKTLRNESSYFYRHVDRQNDYTRAWQKMHGYTIAQINKTWIVPGKIAVGGMVISDDES